MTWIDYDISICQQKPPRSKHLFKTLQNTDDKFEMSTVPYCISCYSLYVKMCKIVADQFNLKIDQKNHWKIEDFNEAIKAFKESLQKVPLSDIQLEIPKLEKILIAISECLKQRMKHNKTCIRPKKDVFPGTTIGDTNHDGFIVDVCEEYKTLVNIYDSYIVLIKSLKNKIIPNVIEQKYKNVLNNCNHRLRLLSDESGKGKERSSSSLEKRSQQRVSRYREYKLSKMKEDKGQSKIRSRRKKSYKID
jgi:hypothetical protein